MTSEAKCSKSYIQGNVCLVSSRYLMSSCSVAEREIHSYSTCQWKAGLTGSSTIWHSGHLRLNCFLVFQSIDSCILQTLFSMLYNFIQRPVFDGLTWPPNLGFGSLLMWIFVHKNYVIHSFSVRFLFTLCSSKHCLPIGFHSNLLSCIWPWQQWKLDVPENKI